MCSYFLSPLFYLFLSLSPSLQFPMCTAAQAISVACLDLRYSVTTSSGRQLKDEKRENFAPIVLSDLSPEQELNGSETDPQEEPSECDGQSLFLSSIIWFCFSGCLLIRLVFWLYIYFLMLSLFGISTLLLSFCFRLFTAVCCFAHRATGRGKEKNSVFFIWCSAETQECLYTSEQLVMIAFSQINSLPPSLPLFPP